MRLDKCTIKLQEAVVAAQDCAQKHNNQNIEPQHMLLALVEQPEGVVRPILQKFGVNPEIIQGRLSEDIEKIPKVYGGATGQIYLSQKTAGLFQKAEKEAEKMKDEYISGEHVLLAFTEIEANPATDLLKSFGITRDALYKALQEIRGSQRVTDQNPEDKYQALAKFS
ncbi:Clp protease N-terminal domain-containing protein, partial [Candidatus Auribacterota bacterium]